jgi:uncharacterized protein YecT (DUF1311 family)
MTADSLNGRSLGKPMTKRDYIIDEIFATKGRRGRISHFAYGRWQLDDLRRQFEGADKHQKYVQRYFPIAIVTTMEVFVRLGIKHLIDYGPPFSERAEPLARHIKFDYAMIKSLEGRAVTVGDIVAHSLSLNRLEQIDFAFSNLIGEDFLKKIAGVVDRVEVEIHKKSATPIIQNPDETYGNIKRLLEVRHVLVHELPEKFELGANDVEEFFEAAKGFMRAIIALIWDLVAPGTPLTQHDMNVEAGHRLANKEKELAEFLGERIAELRASDQSARADKLLEVQECWREFVNLDAEFQAFNNKGGTIWPLIHAGAAERLTESRLADLQKFFDWDKEL